MTRKRTGPKRAVKVISSSELAANPGKYRISGNVAAPIAVEEDASGIEGGPLDMVYVVSDADVASGKYSVEGGSAQMVVDSSVLPSRKIVGGRGVTPVYIVDGGFSYTSKVLGYSPIAYWPLDETSGTNADNLEGTAARDGIFGRNITAMGTGIGIGDGNTAPLFDGTNDFISVPSASFLLPFNGAEGTLAFWAKVSGAGVWSDNTLRRLALLFVDGNNFVIVAKNSSNNIQFDYNAGGTGELEASAAITGSTGWWHCAITWSAAGDVVRYYLLGTEQATDTGLGIWAGTLITVNFGASSPTPAEPWDGYLAHPAIWDTPLTSPQIADLATI